MSERTMIAVFGLGVGALGAFIPGALLRQITDDLAAMLSAFPGLMARPLHLASAVSNELDPNLTEDWAPGSEGGPAPERLKFILYDTLPMNGLLRRLTLEQGCHLALTGRLGMNRDHLALTLNLWEVQTPNLWWCRAVTGDSDTLPTVLAQSAGRLAYSLQAQGAGQIEAAEAHASARLGTRSMGAFEAFAAATDKTRKIKPGQPERQIEIMRVLCRALSIDPDYDAPRLLLTEQAMARLAQKDEVYAGALVGALSNIEAKRLIYGLLRFEASLLIGAMDTAARILEGLAETHPGAPQLTQAAERLTR